MVQHQVRIAFDAATGKLNMEFDLFKREDANATEIKVATALENMAIDGLKEAMSAKGEVSVTKIEKRRNKT